MRSVLLTVKIAVAFGLVQLLVLLGAGLLFMNVAGHDVANDFGRLRGHEGTIVAEKVEALVRSGEAVSGEAVAELLQAEAKQRSLWIDLRPAPTSRQTTLLRMHGRYNVVEVEIRGRHCTIHGPPLHETLVPLHLEAGEPRFLSVRGPRNTAHAHHRFVGGLSYIGLAALLCLAGLAIYLTRPLRRLRRSMDRITAGELEHRIPVSGRDEVAAMSRSFNSMAERIRAMLVGQKELMAGVSHELRSPLARMKVALELMRSQPPSPDRLDQLDAEVDQLEAMVDEVLLASRFELGSVPLAQADHDLRLLAEEAWERVRERAESAGTRLAWEIAPNAASAICDRGLVVRMLGNLFENAARHAEGGTVTVRTRRNGDRIELSVADDGPGVSEEQLGRLFEPFYRADASRSRRTGAGGLGLMIVQRAAQAHGGVARARNRPEGGLVVSFELPASEVATGEGVSPTSG